MTEVSDMGNDHKFTWDELIAASASDRLKMWAALKDVAPDKADWWENSEGCYVDDMRCPHLKDGWCNFAELPCGVNSYLTPRTGMTGMACMGMVPDGQLEMEI